jgi:apolipoprotein N-acyltransferase
LWNNIVLVIRFFFAIPLSTAALTLSQAPFDLGFLAPIALVPWLLLVRRLRSAMAAASGALLGTAYACVAAHWLVPAFASQGAHGYRALFASTIAGFWAEGILFGLIGWVAQRTRSRAPIEQALLLSCVIALGEYWAVHSRLGLPLLLLGYSQHSLPGVMQLAVATGVPGLSALLVAMNSVVASNTSQDSRSPRLALSLVAAWLGLALGGELLIEMLRLTDDSKSRTVLLVQPHFERSHRWDPLFQGNYLQEIAEYTTSALAGTSAPVDLIVWPENVLTQPFDDRNELESDLHRVIEAWGVPLVTGLVRAPHDAAPGEYLSSSVWWSPRRGLIDAVDKSRAIPLVESSRGFPGRDVLAELVGTSKTGPRVSEATIARSLSGEFVVTPVLCFEILFPAEVADRRHAESVAILNLADDSWVGGETVDRQILAAAAFRAIEQRLTVIRVGHGGLSGVIDALGRAVATLPPDEYSHMAAQIAVGEPPSRFEKAAILLLPVMSGAVALLLVTVLSRRRSRSAQLN